MKEYTGAVFYVDILGIEALTQGKIKIINKDFKALNFKYDEGVSEHQFCATLLFKFRKILVAATKNIQNIKVAQLSDCAFIWSSDLDMVIDVARDFMWRSIQEGILCRGGMAHGQIVEPDKINSRIGNFICGGAVTDAVKLERMGKGARIFIKPELVSKLEKIPHHAFAVRKSLIDFSIVDEFLWYKYPKKIKSKFDLCNDKLVVKGLIELIAALKFSPKFRWNASSDLGKYQLASTIDVISLEIENLTPNLDFRFSFESTFKNLDIIRSNDLEQKFLMPLMKLNKNFTAEGTMKKIIK